MIEWHTQQTAHYERDLSYYEKKHLNELQDFVKKEPNFNSFPDGEMRCVNTK